jgi:hypothetical protein
MPKRRGTTRIVRDIKNISTISPTTIISLLGIFIGCIIFFVGAFYISVFTTWLHSNLGLSSGFSSKLSFWATIALFLTLFIGIPIAYITIYNYEVQKKLKGIQIANIDSMNGIEFEHYLQQLLTHQGFSVHITQASGDLGVDLIASRNGEKIAIQAKRYNTKVSRRAISDAVAGMHHYGCNKAMVITNNYFSPGAVMLAGSTRCILVDRDTLAKWVNEFQNTNYQLPKDSQ